MRAEEELELMIARVSTETEIPAFRILGRNSYKPIVAARWKVWRLLRDAGWSYPEIGRAFGRHHTTVLHGVKKGNS